MSIGSLWLYALVLILLTVSGIAYRTMASYLRIHERTPVMPPRHLSTLPMQWGDWAGNDVPVALNTLRVAKNDDYINRVYVNNKTREWVNLYIAYTARPRTMIGHQPDVCYPAGGWIHSQTDHIEVVTRYGRHIPCLLHRFHRPKPGYEVQIVLNYYVVNGRITDDERVFTGVGWRTPNIEGDPARYVAQIQISSVAESAVLSAAREMSEVLIDILPDENGNVGMVRSGT